MVKYKTALLFQPDRQDLVELRQKANHSKWVLDACGEQQPDGSWGRFHTQDSSLKRKYPVTQNALPRLQYLAMKRGDPVIDKACNYMEHLLDDLSLWPDAWEGNKWFKPAVPLFIVSQLAMFGSSNPTYDAVCNTWLAILEASFEGEEYSAQKCNAIAQQLLGVDIHEKNIGLSAKNNILLFACISDRISKELQAKYLKWLHHMPEMIHYCNTTLKRQINLIDNLNDLCNYLKVMLHLSPFGAFKDEFAFEIDWLLAQRDEDGLWDLGNKAGVDKLSDHWRSDINRKIDHTVFVLEILKDVL